MADNKACCGVLPKTVAGTLLMDEGKYYIKGLSGAAFPVQDYFPNGCRVGDKVAAEMGSDGVYTVTVSFGSADDAEANYKAVLAGEGLDKGFDLDAVIQAKETAFAEITSLMAHRVDLRGKTVITMSKSEKSRAECGFSVERDKAGNFVLGLHTVDAAEFIPENSPLENAVFTRGKTVVLPDKEIPMLPDTLSKGPCFLEVGEDRLAVSYLLTIDNEGKVIAFDFCESIIKTAANCLFDEIEALLFNFDLSAIIPLRQAYSSVAPTLNLMFSLGGVLQNARVMGGGADIDRAKRFFPHAIHGAKAIGVVSRKESDPERLVREFLAVAGIELALYLNRNDIPAIYRVQDAPSASAVAEFRSKAALLGINTDDVSDEAVFSFAAEYSHGMRSEELLLGTLHHLLPETGFANTPKRHAVHGSDMYVRFAYPINRCADFCMQRIVKHIIAAREGRAELSKEKMAHIVERGIECATCCESKAGRVEDAIEDIVAFECLRRISAKEYTGLVAAVEADQMAILLDNGCMAFLKLGDEERTEDAVVLDGDAYRYGSEIKVSFDSVDYDEGKLYVKF